MAQLSDADGQWTTSQMKEVTAHLRNGDQEGAGQAMTRLLSEAENPEAVAVHLQQQLDQLNQQ